MHNPSLSTHAGVWPRRACDLQLALICFAGGAARDQAGRNQSRHFIVMVGTSRVMEVPDCRRFGSLPGGFAQHAGRPVIAPRRPKRRESEVLATLI
jgi:hypothetical protein